MTSTPEPRPELLEAHDIAMKALTEVTDLVSIGARAGHEVHDESTVTLFFESLLPGYSGWRWAATVAKVGDDEPITVLEVEQLPGDSALLAPEWVPWAVRLAAYREAQAKQASEEAAAAEAAALELEDVDDVDPDDDLMENDFSDFDDELDGVEIDLFDSDSEESDDEEELDDEELDDEEE